MRVILGLITLFAGLALIVGPASSTREYRGCYINGDWYPHGTTYGRYICLDGEWVRR